MNNTIKIVSIKLRYIIFIIIGILLSFSLPPYNLTIICFVIFPVLLFFLDWLIKKEYSNFFLFGLSFGFGYFLSSLYWISYSLNFDKNLEILKPFAIIFIPLFLSFFYGIVFFIYKKFVGKDIKSILYFSIIFTIVEFVRGNIFTGFPWNLVIYSLSDHTKYLQLLSLFGTYGLHLLFVIFCCIPLLLSFDNVKKNLIIITSFTFFILTAYFYGDYSLEKKLSKLDIKFVVLQPNENIKNIYNKPRTHIKNLINISNPTKYPKNTVFVWPEGSIYFENTKLGLDNISQLFDKKFKPGQKIIFGATNLKNNKVYNSIFFINSDATLISKYDKIKLVPFGEFMPFENLVKKLGFKKITLGYDSFSRGKKRQIFNYNNIKMLPIICYEIIYSGNLNVENKEFNLIVNLSEDGWFNKSIGTYQHFYHSKFRAIEEGKQVIRATNQGITASILPNGIVVNSRLFNQKGKIVSEGFTLKKRTLFSQYGNIILSLLIIILLVLQNIFERIKRE